MSKLTLSTAATIKDAVLAIETGRKTITVVVNESNKLLGTITDGDIRRALLVGAEMDHSVLGIMNKSPLIADVNMSDKYLIEMLKREQIEALPIVDAEGEFRRVAYIHDLSSDREVSFASGFSAAVIMAGGEGRRLRPLTESNPKPMVDVGGIPLIERQIRRMASAGIEHIYIAVNYLSEVIEGHLGDGDTFGVAIEYLREDQKLGTGGALSLLPERPVRPIMVINGDVLTASNFQNFSSFHRGHNGQVTIAAVDYRVEIPYGVIQTDGIYAAQLEEKPSQRFLCNAGIYAVSPEALDLVPEGKSYDMTDLVEDCMKQGRPVAVFPIHEYWSDIGTPAELVQARKVIDDLETAYV